MNNDKYDRKLSGDLSFLEDNNVNTKGKKEKDGNQKKNNIKQDIPVPKKGDAGGALGIDDIVKPRKKRISSIRTYRDFAVDALKSKPTSLANMIIQEKKKQEFKYQHSIKNKKNLGLVFGSVLLVILGILAIALLVFFISKKQEDASEKNVAIDPQSLIYYDYKIEKSLDGLDRGDVFSVAQKVNDRSNIPVGHIKIFYWTNKNEFGYKKLAKADNFFRILDTRAPHTFFRNLSDHFTTGVLATKDGKWNFMILKMKDFDSSYSAMLSWEKSLLYDIGAFFKVNKKYFSQPYNDLVPFNKDVRAVLDEEGNLVFGYSFVDLHTLVIFTDYQQFKYLINTLKNKKEKI